MSEMLSCLTLGIVQGLTEFLPISSSGHLVIFQSILLPHGENVFFDAMLHGGTLLATVLVFWKKIFEILSCSVKKDHPQARESRMWLAWIALATIPTGLIGVLFKDPLEKLFVSPLAVSFMLMVTGLILMATRFVKPSETGVPRMKAWQAIAIGTIQGIAIVPGISRSGSTIAIALLIGISRQPAGEFSFLLSLPSIAGAILLKLKDVDTISLSWISIGTGILAAFAVGAIALLLLMRFVRKGKLHYFAYYCWVIGIFGLFKFWN